MSYLSLIFFYLIGTIPSGYLIAKSKGIDIRKEGSGNVGATNVARTLGKTAGIITLLIDIAKGAIAVLIAIAFEANNELNSLAALMVVLGHCFSIPRLLSGGKGVATAFGASLALAPLTALVAVVVFFTVFKVKKIVSLASISAATSLPISNYLITQNYQTTAALFVIALVVSIRHKENILRILAGEEKTFKAKD